MMVAEVINRKNVSADYKCVKIRNTTLYKYEMKRGVLETVW